VRVVFCGSRTWGKTNDQILAIYDVMSTLPLDAVIVHGAAKGADMLAAGAAADRGNPIEAHPADWEKNGKQAGIIRNLEMLDTKPDLVVAFWDGKSKGTGHMIHAARERGIPVEVTRDE